MVVSQVCPGAALEYWPGVVGARLVKNDIFTAKNTNVYWYGGGAGQNFQPVKFPLKTAHYRGVSSQTDVGQAQTKYLFFFFPTVNSRSEPTTLKLVSDWNLFHS